MCVSLKFCKCFIVTFDNILGIVLLHISFVVVEFCLHGNSCHVECQKAQNHLKTTKTPTHSTGNHKHSHQHSHTHSHTCSYNAPKAQYLLRSHSQAHTYIHTSGTFNDHKTNGITQQAHTYTTRQTIQQAATLWWAPSESACACIWLKRESSPSRIWILPWQREALSALTQHAKLWLFSSAWCVKSLLLRSLTAAAPSRPSVHPVM